MRAKKLTRRRHEERALTRAGMKALAAAGTIAAGTQAYADPVRYDNTGNEWDWNLSGPIYGGGGGPDQFLDIVRAPGDQSTDPNMGYTNFKQGTYPGYNASAIYTYGGVMAINPGGPFGAYALAVAPGTTIGGGGQLFTSLPWIQFTYYNTTSYIPEGVQTYLGTQIKLNGQTHYGWIGVVRSGNALDAFAWGYEDDPGVPVAAGVPEPASLAMLALGFAAVRRRQTA